MGLFSLGIFRGRLFAGRTADDIIFISIVRLRRAVSLPVHPSGLRLKSGQMFLGNTNQFIEPTFVSI